MSLRWCRAVWGSWPLGEAEDWLEPGGAPLLWLLWLLWGINLYILPAL